ncbi:Uncharacterized protein dnm_043560 [Desulfonema magnum]|uniref:Uncharacterized protein n=1 Tax=Desulfonema magnum TaxID=45655 RepID=A0A975BMN2_9BACT|nr:Uncharacterized protein dnm_043560 [Desulfonema magnum]
MDFFSNHQKCKVLLGKYEGCPFLLSAKPVYQNFFRYADDTFLTVKSSKFKVRSCFVTF